MRCVIVLLNCIMLCSCAAHRHTTVLADVRAQVEEIVKSRHYTVAFRYPTVANPNKWKQERAVCHVLGDTLLTFTDYYSSPGDAVAKSFRIEGYRQTVLESGAVEVAFSAREFIPDEESPVAVPWRFVIYSTEDVEIHVDASFLGVTGASVFKGMLCPCEETLTIGEIVRTIEQDGISIWSNGSDLKGLDSPVAKVYMVGNTLPYTVLIDSENKIVAKGLLGSDLCNAVSELVKKNKKNRKDNSL